jgi:hypothetical protein
MVGLQSDHAKFLNFVITTVLVNVSASLGRARERSLVQFVAAALCMAMSSASSSYGQVRATAAFLSRGLLPDPHARAAVLTGFAASRASYDILDDVWRSLSQQQHANAVQDPQSAFVHPLWIRGTTAVLASSASRRSCPIGVECCRRCL